MTTKIRTLLTLIFMMTITVGMSYGQCDGNQAELDAIKQKYETKFKGIESKAKTIKDDAPNPDNPAETTIKADVDITMSEQHFALDVISVTMKDKKLSLNLPQITMTSKSIKFDEPYTIMVLKKTGQYPEIHCKDTWIYGPFGLKTKGVPECKTVWKDIKTEVPEVHTKTTEIKTNLPVFTMKTTEIITAIPEFKMVRQDIKMNLPNVTVKNISAETKKMEQETEQLKNSSQDLIADQKKEYATALSNNFKCQRENLLKKRSELAEIFSISIKDIDVNMEQLKANGFDANNLKSSDGQIINLNEIKTTLIDKEKAALTSIDNAIEELNKKEKETIELYFTK